MSDLIGELKGNFVSVHVSSEVFLRFNNYVRQNGRLRNKNKVINEMFEAIIQSGNELNEKSVTQYLEESEKVEAHV